ncbi:MAG: hypothetical protein P8Y64_06140 [Gammaproteobacteria bacterium]
MDQNALNARCVELFQHPRVQQMMWSPRMFWDIGRTLTSKPTDWTSPKVDLCELEVLLAAAAYVDSQCATELNGREPGRADFIRRAVQSGQRPMLHNIKSH